MLVDVPCNGDVAPGAVSLDVQTIDGVASSASCFCDSPDVQPIPTRGDLNVVAWVCLEERKRFLVRLSVG